MKAARQIAICIIASLLLLGCGKEITRVSEIHDLLPFHQIDLNDTFEVHIAQDSFHQLEVVANESVIGNVEFTVENGILSIDHSTNLKWTKPRKNKIRLNITVAHLSLIKANETCSVVSENTLVGDEIGYVCKSKANEATLDLDCETFYYWNNFPCGGKVTLTGQAETLKIWNFAIMTVDARWLDTKTALIENSSKGDCSVNVTERLAFSIFGEGNIHLYGSPDQIVTGELGATGNLIQH